MLGTTGHCLSGVGAEGAAGGKGAGVGCRPWPNNQAPSGGGVGGRRWGRGGGVGVTSLPPLTPNVMLVVDEGPAAWRPQPLPVEPAAMADESVVPVRSAALPGSRLDPDGSASYEHLCTVHVLKLTLFVGRLP